MTILAVSSADVACLSAGKYFAFSLMMKSKVVALQA